jgi:hypothetical protein
MGCETLVAWLIAGERMRGGGGGILDGLDVDEESSGWLLFVIA